MKEDCEDPLCEVSTISLMTRQGGYLRGEQRIYYDRNVNKRVGRQYIYIYIFFSFSLLVRSAIIP